MVTNQTVAVSITLHRVVTLCSIYIPPSSRLSPKDLDDLIPQLSSPFILLGDFNGHNILWGSKDINDKGRIVESFIDNHGLCLYNTKTPTFLHPATGTYTSLPGLGIGITVASFQDFGTLPVSQMSLKVFKRTEREVSGRCFKNW